MCTELSVVFQPVYLPLLSSPLPHWLFFLPSRLCAYSPPLLQHPRLPSLSLCLYSLLLFLSISPAARSFSLHLPSHSLVLGVAAVWLPASARPASPCQLVNAAAGTAMPCRECVCVCVWKRENVHECTQMGRRLSQGGLPLISLPLSPSFTLPPLLLCCHGAPAGWIRTASAERAEVILCVLWKAYFLHSSAYICTEMSACSLTKCRL